MIGRVGFACKFMHSDQTLKKKLLEEIERPLNNRSTTVKWLNAQSKEVAEQRLWDLMIHNINAFEKIISFVATLPQQQRMLRLGSDVLPVYTEPYWQYFWKQNDVIKY